MYVSVCEQMLSLLLWIVLSTWFLCCSKYSVQRSTSNLGVSYYVKPDFSTEFQGSIRRLEQHVEEDYVSTLRNACFKEKNYSKSLLFMVQYINDDNFQDNVT